MTSLQVSPALRLGAMFSPFRRGRGDPTIRLSDAEVWRSAVTPAGPSSQHITFAVDGGAESLGLAAANSQLPSSNHPPRRTLVSRSYGPGAQWLADRFENLIGQPNPPELQPTADVSGAQQLTVDFVAEHYATASQSWQVPKSHGVWEATVGAILEQRVTGKEAKSTWRTLANKYGHPAPGPVPAGLAVLPEPNRLRQIPSWGWRQMGVDQARSRTLMRVSSLAHMLARLPDLDEETARQRFTSVPGLSHWSYAEMAQRALGDSDAVSVGDYHLSKVVVHSLTGERNGTDAEMLHLMAPYVGQRFLLQRVIESAGSKPERRGPKMSIPPHIYGG